MSSSPSPQAAFHRRSHRNTCTVSKSDNPCRACSTTAAASTYGGICENLGVVLVRLSRYDEAIDAYRKGLTVGGDGFQRARLHVLCSEAEEAAHRYQEALTQCDLAEQALGSAADTPDAQWLSSWLAVQHGRMGVLYWLDDTEGYGKLIERVRPVVEAHGSDEQRMSFLLS